MSTCERQWSPARRRSCMRSSMAARSCCGELAALACRRSALLPCGMATHILVYDCLARAAAESQGYIMAWAYQSDMIT